MAGRKKKAAEAAIEQGTVVDREASIESLSKDIKKRLEGMKACLNDGGRPTMSEYQDMLKDLKTLRRRVLGTDDG